jgi:asparagine synthase (glutamine-hydrolysing)
MDPITEKECIAFQGSTTGMPTTAATGRLSAISFLPLWSYISSEYELLVAGEPRFGAAVNGEEAFCRDFVDAYSRNAEACLQQLTGRFAIALRSRKDSFLLLAADRFASVPVFVARHGSGHIFAETARLLPAELRTGDSISKQALYNYIFFHMIPSPGSIYRNVSKIPPASYVRLEPRRKESTTYWKPRFNESSVTPFATQADELRVTLERAVAASATGKTPGCFLSGGLDSSTVMGYLSHVAKSPVRAFTIGFDAPEYDETSYAQAAAEYFSADLSIYRMGPSDLGNAVIDIARAYDEPFGNSSALPTLFCARLARSQGIDTLLAGDGGDEIFAGNERYAKQKIFEAYFRIPATLRRAVLDRLGKENSGLGGLPGIRKLSSYIRQALIPLPDRLETYNHLFRFTTDRIFRKTFLSEVDVAEPIALLRERFDELEDASALNRMLYLDWKFTLADNDIRKVTTMCQSAGVNVEFPMLNDSLVEFSTTVPSKRKLRGLYLRYFYRKALRDFLPPVVLNKRKHGFGLPFGVWLVEEPELRAFAYDALSRLEQRDIFRPSFISELKTATESEHAAYYGTMIWVMMILEEWLHAHH